MKIRSATAQDTEAIVLLLKQSLGESLIKKTTSIWQFKHQDNPFGVSHVLVAEEKNSLIGVRAFMQWHWQLGDTIQTAYRAVDTATHPSHQGKGVFKKLTLQALEEVAQKQARFIFNTPNSQSLPGYLKMGWKEVDKINVALVPAIVYYFRFLFSSSTRRHSISETKLEELCQLHNQALSQKKMLFTPKTLQYLKWRYEINPMQDYMVYSGSDLFHNAILSIEAF